jgi:hypothetical protein
VENMPPSKKKKKKNSHLRKETRYNFIYLIIK